MALVLLLTQKFLSHFLKQRPLNLSALDLILLTPIPLVLVEQYLKLRFDKFDISRINYSNYLSEKHIAMHILFLQIYRQSTIYVTILHICNRHWGQSFTLIKRWAHTENSVGQSHSFIFKYLHLKLSIGRANTTLSNASLETNSCIAF